MNKSDEIKNNIDIFKKNNKKMSNFLKSDDEWFLFILFSNICLDGDLIEAKEKWEESLIEGSDIIDIIFEDSTNEKWFFIKYINCGNANLVQEQKNLLFLDNILNTKNFYSYDNLLIKNKLEDWHVSDFQNSLKIIYILRQNNNVIFLNNFKEEINKMNLKNEINILDDRKILDFMDISEEKGVANFDLGYDSFFKNDEFSNDLPIGFFNSLASGIVISADTKNLYSLYNKFKHKLFTKNIREYFKSKEDTYIKETIQKEPKNFWFFNNGITILCEEYVINPLEKKITLKNFSIINGAQTVSLIGNNYDKNQKSNMYILIKIIKPLKNASNEGYNDFAEKVIRAANNQKPMKPRDFKSNKDEMINLQKELRENYDIVLDIKRGVIDTKKIKRSNNEFNSYWKYISNEVYAQIYLAMLLQNPAEAIQKKSKIFVSDSLYNQIFKNQKFSIDTSAKIIFNFHQIKERINFVSNGLTVNGEGISENEEIFKRLKFWIYSFIILLSVFSSKINDDSNWNGELMSDYLKNSSFEINSEEVHRLNSTVKSNAGLDYFIKIFFDEAEKLWKNYRETATNKAKNLLAFSYISIKYQELITEIFNKYFVEKCQGFNIIKDFLHEMF